MAGIGKYKKGGKFTLRSGNSPLAFKNMGSSPARIMPSYIDGVQVSDYEADQQADKVRAMGERSHMSDAHWDAYQKEAVKKVERTGGSQVKHLEKTPKHKRDTMDKLSMRDALAEQRDPENYGAEKKQQELNKAYEEKHRKPAPTKDIRESWHYGAGEKKTNAHNKKHQDGTYAGPGHALTKDKKKAVKRDKKSSPAKQATDRETMRQKARDKNKKDNQTMSKVLKRKGKYAVGPMEAKEVYGSYSTDKGQLPRAPGEGNIAHALRKVATWGPIINKRSGELTKSRKGPRRSPRR